jgi:hypothetical protein
MEIKWAEKPEDTEDINVLISFARLNKSLF